MTHSPTPALSHLRNALLGLAALGLAGWAQAQASIQAISGTLQSGAEVLRIELDQPLTAVPDGFVVQTPARIALDFPGVSNATGQNNLTINQGNLRSAALAQASDRTRVVLSLKQATTYKTTLQGKTLLITLDPVATRTAAEPKPSTFAESRSDGTQPLRDVDFRRGTDSAGRIVVDLPSDQVGVDIQQKGKNLVIELAKTSLPEGLRRRLDVTDFGTPVKTIDTVQNGDRVIMTIEPTGQWEHSAYQSDRQLVVEVRQLRSDPDKLVSGPGYRGEKLSLNFQDIDIRSLLQVIADFTNFNVVTSDTVQGNLTLRLQDVPWDQALDIILDAKDLGVKRSGNVLRIAPKDEIAAKEKAELEAQASIRDLEPVRTQAFQLNYTKAEEIRDQLVDGSGSSGSGTGSSHRARLLSDRGSVVIDKRTNQIFISDIPSRLEQIQEMIAKLDIAVQQVLIEARIVEASDTWGRSLGVKLGGADLRGVRGGDPGYSIGNNHRIGFGGNYDAVGSTTGQFAGALTGATSQFLNLPANSVGGSGAAPATFALSLFSSAANRFLNLEISALEADGKGKIVSSPRVVTANQSTASIKQGEERAYQEASSSGATAAAFKEAVLKLEVTPQITPEGNVILDLEINKDSFMAAAAGMEPPISKKEIKTQVLVENGGTVVIGGIFEMEELEEETKVPLLGDIPVVGNLFKSRTREAAKKELLVFITPKIISNGGAMR